MIAVVSTQSADKRCFEKWLLYNDTNNANIRGVPSSFSVHQMTALKIWKISLTSPITFQCPMVREGS